jgi:hypothetical protein
MPLVAAPRSPGRAAKEGTGIRTRWVRNGKFLPGSCDGTYNERTISMIRSALIRKSAIAAVPALAAAVLAFGGATAAHATTQSVDHGATAAAAAAPLSDVADCTASFSGDLCWWVDADEVGKMHPVRDAISNWMSQKEPDCLNQDFDSNGTWNDCASTLYNANGSYGAQVYQNSEYKGDGYCVPPGTLVFNLVNTPYAGTATNMNDSISSNRWRAGGC